MNDIKVFLWVGGVAQMVECLCNKGGREGKKERRKEERKEGKYFSVKSSISDFHEVIEIT
jgi:hypothetical protein